MIMFFDGWVRRIAHIMVVIAGFALLTIVFIIMAEVGMRAMRTPLVGGVELIKVTFLIAVFFAFPHVVVSEREIRVDILRGVVPTASLRYVDISASIISGLFFSFLLWFSIWRMEEAWERAIYLEGRLLIPMWIPWGTIVLGALMSVIASITAMVKYAVIPPTPVDPLAIDERTSQIS